jgi:hypothetical protein
MYWMPETNTFLVSRPAFQILGEKKEWKPVLRKLGRMFFSVSPQATDADYDETYKVCVNDGHFLNSYLCVNKSSSSRNAGMPSVATARAFQRCAIILMSGVLFSAFATAQPAVKITKFHKYVGADGINKRLMKVNKYNVLTALGYDIGLRNWIRATKDGLVLYKEKRRGKVQATLKDYEKMAERQDSMEQRLRILENHLNQLSAALYGDNDVDHADNNSDDESDEVNEENVNVEEEYHDDRNVNGNHFVEHEADEGNDAESHEERGHEGEEGGHEGENEGDDDMEKEVEANDDDEESGHEGEEGEHEGENEGDDDMEKEGEANDDDEERGHEGENEGDDNMENEGEEEDGDKEEDGDEEEDGDDKEYEEPEHEPNVAEQREDNGDEEGETQVPSAATLFDTSSSEEESDSSSEEEFIIPVPVRRVHRNRAAIPDAEDVEVVEQVSDEDN